MKMLRIVSAACIAIVICSCSREEKKLEIRKPRTEIKKTDEANDSGSVSESDNETNAIGLRTIESKEANRNVGDSLNVRGFVADVYESPKVIYLNFGSKFPKNDFTCTIFAGSLENFSDIRTFLGKRVEVTGRITIYKSKPQMILWSQSQIKILK
jgi:hypothetical protein